MSDATGMEPPKPTAEHLRIQKLAGKWNVDCTFFMDPSQPPMQCKAVETFELVGPFWAVSKYETEFMGAPFVGRSTLGYDPRQKLWLSSWIDCMSPVQFQFTGTMKGDTLTMTGEAWSCMTNQVALHRITHRHVNADAWVAEMFQAMPDGKEFQMMRCAYRRA